MILFILTQTCTLINVIEGGFKMKKVLLALLSIGIITGFTVDVSAAENPSQSAETKNSISSIRWIYYYTDHSLSDGWYEDWYYYVDAKGKTKYKVETFNSKGKLVRTRYL